jgi:hypothetical protein
MVRAHQVNMKVIFHDLYRLLDIRDFLQISERILTQTAERELRTKPGKRRRRRLELPGSEHNNIDFLPLEDISIQQRARVDRIYAHHTVFPGWCCKRYVSLIRPYFLNLPSSRPIAASSHAFQVAEIFLVASYISNQRLT